MGIMPKDSIEHSSQAVFSICASPDVSMAATAACAEVEGSSYVGEFNDTFLSIADHSYHRPSKRQLDVWLWSTATGTQSWRFGRWNSCALFFSEI
jgi:hypothetical protein